MKRRLERARSSGLLGSLGVFALTSVVIVRLLRLWHADLRAPFGYSGDAILNIALVRAMVDHGWFVSNPDLGFPFGQHLDVYAPSGDNLTFAVMWVLALFTSNPALIVNLVYLLSFPVIAVVAFLVLRRLGISGAVAALCAVLYTLAPYHFLRNEGHLLLACYYTVPLGALLVLDALAGRPLFSPRASSHPRALRWASRRTLGTLAICAVVASGGIYYSVFALVLLAAVLIVAVVTRRERTAIFTTAALLSAILGVTLLNLAPGLAYRLEHGKNPYAAQRAAFESELYGLKIVDLVLPVQGHRIEALNQRRANYHRTTPLKSEATGALGIIGTIGFGWLWLVALATLAGRSVLRRPRDAGDERERHAAFATIVAVVVGTTGGASALIAYGITPQIRGWNRISIVIAFFALYAVALLLDRLRGRIEPLRGGRVLTAALLVAILLVGIYDQTNRSFVPNYSALKVEYASDANFARAIDRAVAPGSAVMQLPYVPFPENPPLAGLPDYELLRPYIHGGGLRWSYGVVKGSPDDWQAGFFGVTPKQASQGFVQGPLDNGRSPRENFAALVAVGFAGVHIDRLGYGGGVGSLEQALQRIVGRPPLVSSTGRMAFYSLAPYAEQLRRRFSAARLRALGVATVRPLVVTFGEGFYPLEKGKRESWRWALRSARLEIDNPAGGTRLARLRTTIQTSASSTIAFTLPDGTVVRRRAGTGGREARVSLDIRLRPGRNIVRIATDAPRAPSPSDARTLFMRLADSTIEEPSAVLAPSTASSR